MMSSNHSRASSSIYKWTSVLFLALLCRLALFHAPHSGQATPPMFGDYEAQRHWMDVTLHVPLINWYRNASGNNLQYWGLDYPPGAAFLARAIGEVAERWVPALVAPTSFGHETSLGKAFMRLSVIAADAFFLVPGIVAAAIAVVPPHGSSSGDGGSTSLILHRRLAIAALVLTHPALVLIDHGHFQYNGVGLGLVLGAAAALESAPLIAAVIFTAALQMKQTMLYYAPVFFALLLAKALSGGFAAILGTKPSSLLSSSGVARHATSAAAAAGIAALAVAVIATTALFWAPFCIAGSHSGGGGGGGVGVVAGEKGGVTGCISALNAIASRLVPLDRGLFEDKVGNLWCAFEPLLRVRARLFVLGHVSTRQHFIVAAACAVAVATLAAPSVALIFYGASSPSLIKSTTTITTTAKAMSGTAIRRALLGLFTVSLSFFLAAYQVHEKAIILSAIPLAVLSNVLPITNALFSVAAVFSMWPLLAKDRLEIHATIAVVAYLLLIVLLPLLQGRKNSDSSSSSSSSSSSYTETGHLALGLQFLGIKSASVKSTSRVVRLIAVVAIITAAAISTAVIIGVEVPRKLPDLFQYLTSLWSAVVFLIFLCVGTLILLGWTIAETAKTTVKTDIISSKLHRRAPSPARGTLNSNTTSSNNVRRRKRAASTTVVHAAK
jgi:alpha-1,3-glucosyltransferase